MAMASLSSSSSASSMLLSARRRTMASALRLAGGSSSSSSPTRHSGHPSFFLSPSSTFHPSVGGLSTLTRLTITTTSPTTASIIPGAQRRKPLDVVVGAGSSILGSRLLAAVSRSSRHKTTSSTTNTSTGTGTGSGSGQRDTPSIPLSPEEAQLFDTLLAVVEDEQLGTTLRVAGGWVRDKVLGHWSPDGKVDIDIALDNMMGSEFAATLNRWLAKRGRKMYNVGIISRNPEKSKHLETATMRVGTFWIDFVNLRTEAYTDGSRIPSMDIGGPEEDALRRDLTINALYFNVNTGEVEDFCGRGLADMREGIIRTPLPAFTTLLDDPLRVLRSVRFASRLDFAMSSDLVEAASDPRVHKALAQKVSRERIGSEVDLMIRSTKPFRAMTLIGELGLAQTVFPSPLKVLPSEDEAGSGSQVEEGAERTLPVTWYRTGLKAIAEMEMGLRFKNWGLSGEEVRLALYASLLLPLASARYIESSKKNKPIEVSRYIFARMLKLKAKDADKIVLLHEVVGRFQPYLAAKGDPRNPSTTLEPAEKRAEIGQLLLQVGPLWRAALLLAAVKASLEARNPNNKKQSSTSTSASTSTSTSDSNVDDKKEGKEYSYREAALRVSNYITEAALTEVWEQAPPFDGEGLRTILPSIPHGPPFRQVMDKQVHLWLREPQISKEDMGVKLVEAFPDFAGPPTPQ